jgi:hypothetical protein
MEQADPLPLPANGMSQHIAFGLAAPVQQMSIRKKRKKFIS